LVTGSFLEPRRLNRLNAPVKVKPFGEPGDQLTDVIGDAAESIDVPVGASEISEVPVHFIHGFV